MLTESIKLDTGAILEAYIRDPSVSFRDERKRPAIIICPGGAYLIHAIKEGEPVALDFLARGYHCFVLKYSVGIDRYHPEKGENLAARYPIQALELMEAIHIIHQNAGRWYVNDECLFLLGFSAGGHVCATVGTRWNDPALTEKLSFVPKQDELRCSGMVLGYPMLADNPESFKGSEFRNLDPERIRIMNHVFYGKDTPSEADISKFDLRSYISKKTIPALIWNTADDPVVDPGVGASFAQMLASEGINCEYHMFSSGGHGMGLACSLCADDQTETDKTVTIWRTLAQNWMQEIMRRKEK